MTYRFLFAGSALCFGLVAGLIWGPAIGKVPNLGFPKPSFQVRTQSGSHAQIHEEISAQISQREHQNEEYRKKLEKSKRHYERTTREKKWVRADAQERLRVAEDQLRGLISENERTISHLKQKKSALGSS